MRKLARGGMAELFLARTIGPEGFEKLVVLKKILPSYSENPKFVRLFLDEAKLAATLDHPHIAHVYDMGKVEGHYFFTMEYVHGQDVRTVLRRNARLGQQLPLDHAVQVARNVAAALHYAHERKRPDGALLDIVHRDVSPSNILVSYDGAVKLVDFGVAKAATSTVKTRTGTLKGKISYMSPEQAKGSPIDRRSDIFSLGIVLWEMVTTQRLFKTDNDLATIQMIINSKPQPPSELRPECTPELERITLRALASNIEERYQTAEQLQLDLEELAREQKLKQSSVAIRTWMHELFAEEIRAWSLAQASGQTLTEHLGAAEMTTPVSESELDIEYDDEDHDSEQIATMAGPGTHQIAVVPPPQQVGVRTGMQQAVTSVLIADQVTQLMPEGVAVDLRAPNHTPFPVAPLEWRPSVEEMTSGPDPNEQRKKRIIIGASVTFGVLVLAALALGGNKQAAKAAAAPAEPAESSTKLEMKSQPTPVEKAPEEPTIAEGSDAPAEEAEEVEEPKPKKKAEKKAAKADKPPAIEKKPVEKLKSATTPKPAEKPPVTKPAEKPPVVKPAEKPPVTKPAEKPPVKVEPVKPVEKPKPQKWDPNGVEEPR